MDTNKMMMTLVVNVFGMPVSSDKMLVNVTAVNTNEMVNAPNMHNMNNKSTARPTTPVAL